MIRDIIWDAGGTLFDTYPAKVGALRETLERFGGEADPERILRLTLKATSHAVATLAREVGVERDAFEADYRERYAAVSPEEQPPFPHVRELCQYIRRAGGHNYIVTHRGRDSLLGLLEVHEMTGLFRELVTKEAPYPRKPDPAALKAVVERWGLDPQSTLAVGDRDLDIRAAQAAGLRTCFFGSHPHEMQAELEVREYAALFGWLLREKAIGSDPGAPFWHALDALVASSSLVIDRRVGSAHPRYPDFVYPLDYGYLAGTSSGDGDGIDVWIGAGQALDVTGVVLTVDLLKRDAEVKLLLGCSPEEQQRVGAVHNKHSQLALVVSRPPETT